jgi:purine-binding chemotaxis protein CheW
VDVSAEPSVQWLCFEVAGARMAIAAEHVEEILPLGTVTPVPLAPPRVRGLMSLRGDALPLLDLAVFLELAGSAEVTTVVVCRTAKYRVGLLAARARGIRNISAAQRALPRLARPVRLRELAVAEVETAEGLDVLLDIDAVLEAARVRR